MSAILLLVLAALPGPVGRDSAPAPNVLVLLADDLGLELLRSYDAENVYPEGIAERFPDIYPRTPTLDALARRGVRFTQARVPPTCSSSRASILTGRYPFRHGIGGLVRRSDSTPLYEQARTIELGVGPGNQEWTLAHVARAAGHHSFLSGKWHLALLSTSRGLGGGPGAGWSHITEVAGFDRYWTTWSNLPKPDGYFNCLVGTDGEVSELRGEYVTTAQVDRLLEYVDEQGDDPWFVFCAFNAVHTPYRRPPEELVSTAAYLEQIRERNQRARRSPGTVVSSWPIYCAMVEALDHEIGRLLAGLEERGRLDDTMILFLADNGPPKVTLGHAVVLEKLDLGETVKALLRSQRERFKHTVFECGVRVPLIVSGPLVGSPGRSCDALVDGVDVFETVREILGVKRADVLPDDHPVDGVSFLPLLRSADAPPARTFSFCEHFEPNGDPGAIVFHEGRMTREHMLRRGFVLETLAGRFKLVRNLDRHSDGRDLFFQLSDAQGRPVDPWEQVPLLFDEDGPQREIYLEVRAALEALVGG